PDDRSGGRGGEASYRWQIDREPGLVQSRVTLRGHKPEAQARGEVQPSLALRACVKDRRTPKRVTRTRRTLNHAGTHAGRACPEDRLLCGWIISSAAWLWCS